MKKEPAPPLAHFFLAKNPFLGWESGSIGPCRQKVFSIPDAASNLALDDDCEDFAAVGGVGAHDFAREYCGDSIGAHYVPDRPPVGELDHDLITRGFGVCHSAVGMRPKIILGKPSLLNVAGNVGYRAAQAMRVDHAINAFDVAAKVP